VTGTATLVVPEDDAPLDALSDESGPGAPFLDALVARLHAEYGVDRDQVRRLAAEVLAGFATARVQTFVPILVEKRLRQICRATG
jgi:pyrroline-5-carboxylate reductase